MAHETRDTNVRLVVYGGIGLAVLAAVVSLFLFGVLRLWVLAPPEPTDRPFAGAPAEFPPGPRLLENPAAEMEALRQQTRQRLSTYGWVDREKGVVHVPIERAMELQLQRGFPVRAPARQAIETQGGTAQGGKQ